MISFLKRNSVLVTGIILPILMVVVFAIASSLPKYFVASPKYDLIFATQYYEHSNPGIRFSVNDGKLRASLICNPCNANYQQYWNHPRLYIYDAEKEAGREISYEIPKIEFTNESLSVAIIIPELESIKIDTSEKSPDGYSYKPANYSGGGIFPGLFYGGHSRKPSIHKDGNTIPLLKNDSYYYDTKFIGWIVKE